MVTPCRWPAWVAAAVLVACQPPADDPRRELPGSSTTTAAEASSGPGPVDPSTSATSGPVALDGTTVVYRVTSRGPPQRVS